MNSAGQPIAPSGVLGGGVLKVDDYAAFLAREYLTGYVPAGGAAVKVAVVGDGGAADRLESALAAATAEHRGLHVSISAESADSVRGRSRPARLQRRESDVDHPQLIGLLSGALARIEADFAAHCEGAGSGGSAEL